MALPPEASYVLSGEARIGAAPGSPGGASPAQAEYIVGTCIAPTTIFSTFPTAPVEGDTGGLWRRFARPVGAAPVGATAIRVSFSAVSVPGDAFDVRLDNLLLAPTIFADGFETANTNRLECDRPMNTGREWKAGEPTMTLTARRMRPIFAVASGGRLCDADAGRRDRCHPDLRPAAGLELGLSRGAAGSPTMPRRSSAACRSPAPGPGTRPDPRSSSSTIRPSNWCRARIGSGYFPRPRPESILTNLFAVQANRAYLLKIDGNVPVTWTVTGTPGGPELPLGSRQLQSRRLPGRSAAATDLRSVSRAVAGARRPADLPPRRRAMAGDRESLRHRHPLGRGLLGLLQGPVGLQRSDLAIELDSGKRMDFAASGDRSRVRIRNLAHRAGVDLDPVSCRARRRFRWRFASSTPTRSRSAGPPCRKPTVGRYHKRAS